MPQIHWIVPTIGIAFLYTGIFLIYTTCFSKLPICINHWQNTRLLIRVSHQITWPIRIPCTPPVLYLSSMSGATFLEQHFHSSVQTCIRVWEYKELEVLLPPYRPSSQLFPLSNSIMAQGCEPSLVSPKNWQLDKSARIRPDVPYIRLSAWTMLYSYSLVVVRQSHTFAATHVTFIEAFVVLYCTQDESRFELVC